MMCRISRAELGVVFAVVECIFLQGRSLARPPTVHPDPPPQGAKPVKTPKGKWPGVENVNLDFASARDEHATFDQEEHKRLAAVVACLLSPSHDCRLRLSRAASRLRDRG